MPRVILLPLCIAILIGCAKTSQHEANAHVPQPIAAGLAKSPPLPPDQLARIVVLELGPGPNDSLEDDDLDVLGLHIEPETLRDIIPWLEAEHVTHVLFRVNSRGGAIESAADTAQLIHDDFNPRFHTSAWLVHAQRAASIAVLPCEQWIVHPSGTYESMIRWVYPFPTDDFVTRMASLASPPRNNATVLVGLFLWRDLSADIDASGKVTWRDDTDGQVLVSSRPDRYPALNAQQMVTLGLAVGSADSLDQALELAAPGPRELVATEVNALLRAERQAVERDTNTVTDVFTRYRAAMQLLSQPDAAESARAVYHEKATEALEEIAAIVGNRPSLNLFVLNMTPAQFSQWKTEQEALLRELRP